MFLHRIIPVAPFVADPDWSRTQVVPPLLAGTTSPTNIRPVFADQSAGMIYWTAIPYNGADPTVAQPSSGVGLTFDARLVWSRQPKYDGKPSTIVVGRKSPGEVEGALIPVGREIIEAYPPRGTAGILQMLSFAGAPPPGTTHLYLFFAFEPQGWR